MVVGEVEEPYVYTDQEGNSRASLQVRARTCNSSVQKQRLRPWTVAGASTAASLHRQGTVLVLPRNLAVRRIYLSKVLDLLDKSRSSTEWQSRPLCDCRQ